jgi:hypothetical protein
MADLAAIREGLRANLAAITGCQVSAYMLSNPTTPSLQVNGPDEIIYDLSMQRGLDQMTVVVQGLVGSPTDIGRQVVLDQWLAPTGAKSVKAAIEADHTLGGLVAGTRVARVSGYRVYVLPNQGATLGAEWFVDIHNPGS